MNDRDHCLLQIQQGYGLQYVPLEFKDDKEIVLAAIQKYAQSFFHISERLQMDFDVILSLIRKDSSMLGSVHDVFKDNEKIVSIAIEKNPWLLDYASDRIKNNKNIALRVLHKEGMVFVSLHPDLKENRQIVLTALKNGCILKYVPIQFHRKYYIKKGIKGKKPSWLVMNTIFDKDRSIFLSIYSKNKLISVRSRFIF